jgi:hypothetical protein
MKAPKMPKNKTLASLKAYDEKLNEYQQVKNLEKKVSEKRKKIK